VGRRLAAKEELYSWLFVNTIPVLVEEKKIERQSKIETWLNLYQITRELNIQKPDNSNNTSIPINYII
jgi:hypothetical protein